MNRERVALIYLLFMGSMILCGSGIYLLLETPEKSLLGWILVSLGLLLFLLTIYYYAKRRKDKRSDVCGDCATYTPDCGILPDCDGKPDCDCMPDCSP